MAEKLPKYCYARGTKVWVRYKDVEGKWVSKPTPYTTDQVEYVRRFINAILRGVEAKKVKGTASPNTVREYVEKWTEERIARGVSSAKLDRAKLRKYALPHVGDLPIETVRPRHVRDMVRELRKLKDEDGNPALAPRTIHHIFNALFNVFENAIVDELYFGDNPVKVKPGELPKKVDADAEWRSQATFAVKEVKDLIKSPLIPVERRVQYALKALAGFRHQEVAALCVRHIDWDAEPLARLNVVQAYDSINRVIKSTKSEETRQVPVHPTLAKVLKQWLEVHWPRIYGRKPTLDDLVVPTRNLTPVNASDANEAFKRDLGSALGYRLEAGSRRDRGGHDLRSWFQTRCIEDGADSLLLRRTTHAPPKDVNSGYERFSWATLCRELGKLKFDVPDEEILALATHSLQAEKKAGARWTSEVTPKGLERLFVVADGALGAVSGRPSYHPRSLAHTRHRKRVTRPLRLLRAQTAGAMLERALRVGDIPRALQIAEELKQRGTD